MNKNNPLNYSFRKNLHPYRTALLLHLQSLYEQFSDLLAHRVADDGGIFVMDAAVKAGVLGLHRCIAEALERPAFDAEFQLCRVSIGEMVAEYAGQGL